MHEPTARQPFTLRVEPDDPAPAYVQLERQLRIAVADGVLQPGDRLPSVRATAAQLGLATNTVGRAYSELARGGVLVSDRAVARRSPPTTRWTCRRWPVRVASASR
jgi:DNA-binding transcriptional MocR family regulator